MTPFTEITAPVLILPEDRIDTDILFPARFLLLMERAGLGRYLCYDRRFDADGTAIANPIDPALAAGAKIVIAGRDFGCGSSREQAVWALADAGITCVIAEALGPIFAENCLRNGVLTIEMDGDEIAALTSLATVGPLTVDLPAQRIGRIGEWRHFVADAGAKERLLNGWDEIDTIIAQSTDDLAAFEQQQRGLQPWLHRAAVGG
jgi:3-isopropylmalate dehydratase small subunit